MVASLIFAGFDVLYPESANNFFASFGVVGEGISLDIAGRFRRRHHRQWHRGAAVERLRQRFFVDGVMGGKPHVLVGKAEVAAGLNDDDALNRVEFGLEIRHPS